MRYTNRKGVSALQLGYGRRRKFTFRRLKSIVRNYQTPEQKYNDNTQTGTSIATGTQQLLNDIANGNGVSDRIGRKITMTSALIRLNWDMSAATNNTNTIRVMLVYDSQPNQAQYAGSDLLADASSGAAGLNILSPLNLDNRDRFTILHDKQFSMVKGTETEKCQMQIYKKFRLSCTYDNTTGTIADLTTGALYLDVRAENSDATAVFKYYTRLRYIDN